MLTDNPNAELPVKVGEKTIVTPLDSLYRLIAAEKKPQTLPAIYGDVRAMFEEKFQGFNASMTRSSIQGSPSFIVWVVSSSILEQEFP